ncbi:MAG TPA: hypothetical protein VIU65_02605 [Pyrinomonadaceae bacterium]
MRRLFFALTLVMASFGLSQLVAQERPIGPPPALLIVREEIKPGQMPAHNRHSASFAKIFARLQTNNYRIAMVPIAGNENEVLYITPVGTFAELERMQQDTDKKMGAATGATRAELGRLEKEAPDLHAGMRDLFAVHRPEMGYDPVVDIATMRYFAITTVRIRPGMEDEYVEYIRTLTNVARQKAKAELHIAAFQVIAGAPTAAGPTYMFFRPMKSISDYDLRTGPRTREAMTDDQKKKADKMNGEIVLNSETSVYAFVPQMSYVPKEMAARDAAFWNPKTEETATPGRTPRKPRNKNSTTGNPQ